MIWLQWLTFFVSFVLHVLVVASLGRGGYKSYPFVFVYCLVFLVTITGEAAVYAHVIVLSKASRTVFFHQVNAAREFLLFAVVVSLIERALQSKEYRVRLRFGLGMMAVLAVFLTLSIHSGAPTLTLQMTEVSRDLSFGSGALTLVLWSILIASRKRDQQLLMITGGLGLQFTGEAIGSALRQLSSTYNNGVWSAHHYGLQLTGNLFLSASHLLRLFVWWQAFRRIQALEEPDKKEPGREVPVFPGRAHNQTLFEESNA
jgi:hypothetical protein